MSLRVVILCGGSGLRLWPESRQNLPKQFIPIIDGKCLLDLTIERSLYIQNQGKPIFICNKKHNFLVKESIDKFKLDADIILEPEGKSTTAAIYLSAKHCSTNDNLLIMPADHLIPDNKKFAEIISNISNISSFKNWITLGVKPTKPSEAYGYIKASKIHKNKNLLKVEKFIEKPTKEIASMFIKDRTYFWNAGIFLGNSAMIQKSIVKHAPEISIPCDEAFKYKKISNENNEISFSDNLFSKIPSKSIDFSVMEHASNINLYPMNEKWNDVGSWDSLSEIYGYKNLSQNVVEVDSYDNFIRSKKRIIATIGIKDLIIIDSDNATLIAKKNHSEKVKLIAKKLMKNNNFSALISTFEKKPWGQFQNLLDNSNCKIKQLKVNPKQRLSLQYHNYRSEHWLIIKGTATVYLEGKISQLTKGMSIDIPKKHSHYIHNETNEELIIIETQLGTYFGEDDIIRLDDPYNR